MDITELQRNQIATRHPWEKTRAKIIKKLILNERHCSHILDTGSGDSFVLNYLCSFKLANHYTAVDIAYTNEIITRIRKNISCNVNFFSELPNKLTPKADTVLLLDVLEHCLNESDLLQKLNSDSLTHSPVFFITVPAFQQLFSSHDKLLGHYRRYTLRSIKDLCHRNRLEVISSGYFFTSLLAIRSIQLFLEKLGIRTSSKSIDNWTGNQVMTKLISSILWVDFLIGRVFLNIGIRLPGLSVYCICRPSPL
jgi:hypothetical protein